MVSLSCPSSCAHESCYILPNLCFCIKQLGLSNTLRLTAMLFGLKIKLLIPLRHKWTITMIIVPDLTEWNESTRLYFLKARYWWCDVASIHCVQGTNQSCECEYQSVFTRHITRVVLNTDVTGEKIFLINSCDISFGSTLVQLWNTWQRRQMWCHPADIADGGIRSENNPMCPSGLNVNVFDHNSQEKLTNICFLPPDHLNNRQLVLSLSRNTFPSKGEMKEVRIWWKVIRDDPWSRCFLCRYSHPSSHVSNPLKPQTGPSSDISCSFCSSSANRGDPGTKVGLCKVHICILLSRGRVCLSSIPLLLRGWRCSREMLGGKMIFQVIIPALSN